MQVRTPAQNLFFTTVRVETESAGGTGCGTAFMYRHDWGGLEIFFLVTNKHVVQGSNTGRFFFTKSNYEANQPRIGQRYDIELGAFESQWHGHPDPDVDVATMPLYRVIMALHDDDERIFASSIQPWMIPTAKQIEEIDAVESVLFLGYPNGIFDRTNLIPIARRGVTATPIQLDYDGRPEFLIDASVFPGSSGSPVFLCDPGTYVSGASSKLPIPDQTLYTNSRLYFLGLISQVIIRTDRGELEFEPIPTLQRPIVRTQQMIDLGIVIKARTVAECISDYINTQRVDFERELDAFLAQRGIIRGPYVGEIE